MSEEKKWMKWSIGLTCAAGVGYLLWHLADDGNSNQQSQASRKLSQQEYIEVLKTLEDELHIAFKTLAGFVQSINSQTRGMLSKQDMKEVIKIRSPYMSIVKNI